MNHIEVPNVPSGLAKILKAAEENDWSLNGTGITTVARLHKPDDPLAKPFYVSYWLTIDRQTGKCAWRFHGAYASNGQALNYQDVFTYLEDTAVIHPEPPGEVLSS